MKYLMITAGALVLAGCQTAPTAYAPIGDGKTGFYEQPIESDRFRVSFVGKSEGEARDFALLRAAEIAVERGYSHFEVLRGATEGDARRGGVRPSVGVGVGSGGGYYGRRRTNVGLGVGFDLGQLGGKRVSHSIEVKLRRNGSDAPNTYSAKDVIEAMTGRVEV